MAAVTHSQSGPASISSVPIDDVRILVVDDEPDLREVVTTRLRSAGWSVDEAASGPEALAAIDGCPYDVVVLDVMMPGMTGLEVLSQIAHDENAPSIIVLSAKSDIDTRVQSLELGAIDYLAKPFASAELVARIATALRARARLKRAISVSLEDPLTGLGNRRAFDMLLQQEVARARRYARPVSVIMADADGLKRVNDSRGHGIGDKLLCAVAEAIRRTLRISDHAARIGGDEFAMILPETNRDAAEIVVRRLEHALKHAPYHDIDLPRASMGIASFPEDANDVDALLRVADERLYAVKGTRGSQRPR
jgi:diguanylate cyclase (GGDEF)-like protein